MKKEKDTIVRVMPVIRGKKYKNGRDKIEWAVIIEKVNHPINTKNKNK